MIYQKAQKFIHIFILISLTLLLGRPNYTTAQTDNPTGLLGSFPIAEPNAVKLADDGQSMVLATDKQVSLYNLANHTFTKLLEQPKSAPVSFVPGVAISSDNAWIAYGTSLATTVGPPIETIMLYEITTQGTQPLFVYQDYAIGRIVDLKFDTSAQNLATIGKKHVVIYDLTEKNIISTRFFEDELIDIAFIDENTIFTATHSGFYVWDIRQDTITYEYDCLQCELTSALFFDPTRMEVTWAYDLGYIFSVNIEDDELLLSLETEMGIRDLKNFSGQFLVYRYFDVIRYSDIETLKVSVLYDLEGDVWENDVVLLEITSENHVIVANWRTEDAMMEIWDLGDIETITLTVESA